MEERDGREREQLVVGFGEEVGEILPTFWVIKLRVGRGGGLRREGEEAACLLDFSLICAAERDEILFGVGNRFEELGLGLSANEFNVLLEPKHEL